MSNLRYLHLKRNDGRLMMVYPEDLPPGVGEQWHLREPLWMRVGAWLLAIGVVAVLTALFLAGVASAEEPTATPAPSPTATVAPVACVNGRHPTDPALPCSLVMDPVMQLNQRLTALEQNLNQFRQQVAKYTEVIEPRLLPLSTPEAPKRK